MLRRNRTERIIFWAIVAGVATPFAIVAARTGGALLAVVAVVIVVLLGHLLDKYGG